MICCCFVIQPLRRTLFVLRRNIAKQIGLFGGLKRIKRKIIVSDSVRLHMKLFLEIELIHFENLNYLFSDVKERKICLFVEM